MIYNCLYAIFFFLKRISRCGKENGKLRLFIRRIFLKYQGYLTIWLNHQARKQSGIFRKGTLGITGEKKREKMIVATLTTFPARIDTVAYAIQTIMAQSVKPDKILLWLAKSQFSAPEKLPQNLLALQERGLEIRFCDDLKSHKKYYYAFQEFPDHLVITFDDDLLYPRDTIKKLYKLHKKHPDAVCCISAMDTIAPEQILPSEWKYCPNVVKEQPNKVFQPFTGAGTLFCPERINSEVFNWEHIVHRAIYADDLWLFHQCRQSEVSFVKIRKFRAFPISVLNQNRESLFDMNASATHNLNDVQWNAIIHGKDVFGQP